jgi:predicted amidohydrolase
VVPSCTDTLAGYNRVRIGARARALENQCYLVQSPTVGTAPWSEAVDCNIGAAAAYAPVDRGFPCDGLIVEGSMNAAQWVHAQLDTEALQTVRASGQVFNYRDWEAHEKLAGVPRDHDRS